MENLFSMLAGSWWVGIILYVTMTRASEQVLCSPSILTKVWTMSTLLCLIFLTNSYTFTDLSALIRSNIASKVMKVPVLPTPALQCTSNGLPTSLLWPFCTLLMKEMREVANLGTPWSGQDVKWYWVILKGSAPSVVCEEGGG